MSKKPILNEEIKKLKIQLGKDILGYNQQIVNLTAQINRVVGGKMEAEGILKIVEAEDALCKKG